MPQPSDRHPVRPRSPLSPSRAYPALLTLILACTACQPASPVSPLDVTCTVTDGDTLRCGEERVRLLAVDAPEMPGHCHRGRTCVEGDPHEAKGSLQNALAGRSLSIRRFGQDRYGRTLAVVYADGQSTSCYQLAAGHAAYVEDWDENRVVARECPQWAR